jgi:hypothetical protein
VHLGHISWALTKRRRRKMTYSTVHNTCVDARAMFHKINTQNKIMYSQAIFAIKINKWVGEGGTFIQDIKVKVKVKLTL